MFGFNHLEQNFSILLFCLSFQVTYIVLASECFFFVDYLKLEKSRLHLL